MFLYIWVSFFFLVILSWMMYTSTTFNQPVSVKPHQLTETFTETRADKSVENVECLNENESSLLHEIFCPFFHLVD